MIQLQFRATRMRYALMLVVLLVPGREAGAIVVQWLGPDLGNWNTDANWTDGIQVNGCCGEVAAINNNTTAVLSAPADFPVNGLILGQTAGNSGGLRITNGGSLESFPAGGEAGALNIGAAGQGNLTILGGGSLSGTTLSLGGATGSSILLGDTSGLTASLTTTGNATLNRTTQVIGRFVNFNAGGNLTLGSAGTLIGQINHASLHSPLKAAGAANVGGTFKVEFSGVTPAAGNTWNIIDAATINGNFATLDTSAAPSLPAGQVYRMRRTTGGTNGQLLQLTVQQVLALQVNRSTGAVSIANIGASPVTLDGYSILSSFGALNGPWNSLQDQGVAGWVEAAPTATELSELRPQAGGLTLSGGQSRALGTPYIPVFPAFGVDPDHLAFEYSTPDGDIFTGVVQYTGTKVHNNFVLNVNPATGQVAFRNDSPFSIAIDGYAIYSASGSLTPGMWNSLQDQNVSGWEQAPPSPGSTVVSELKADGATTLQGQTGFNLGQLFKIVGGTQDLRFEFLMAGSDTPSVGTVVYGPFTPPSPPLAGLPGDFNSDGKVDAADYVVWRKTGGTSQQYNVWRSNFGTSLGSGSGSKAEGSLTHVPEPNTVGLFLLGAFGAAGMRMRAYRLTNCRAVAGGLIAIILSFGAGTASAQVTELYYEDFEDTTLQPNTFTNLATIANGFASFNDTSDTTRARFVVIQTFNEPVVTYSFDVVAPATRPPGLSNELRFRAGIGTANNTLQAADFIFEALLWSNDTNQGAYTNNGNESIFLVANNKDSALVFTSPIDGSDFTLNAFQYVPFVRDNNSGVFGLVKGATDFVDKNGADPGAGTVTRFGIGSSTNAHQGTFALDNVRVMSGVFLGDVPPLCGAGDANCDGMVDLENDFEAIRLNFRKSPRTRTQGDLTGDSLVSLPDFVQWKTAFLSGGGSLEGLSLNFLHVPEPAAGANMMLGMLGLLARRWSRRSRENGR